MAKTIATVSGVALAPGVSRNGRRYTAEAIARAVSRAQARIADGSMPMTMLTHHAAEDDSTKIVGRVTSMTVGENGEARFTAGIADTPDGRIIASLLDTSDGQDPFLRNVSIRGAWAGKVRRENTPSGPVETGDDLELDGLDYTRKPGVDAARVEAFAWAKGGAQETSERVPITESVQEACVTISEETAPAVPAAIREALAGMLGTGIAEAGTPPVSQRDSGMTGSGRVWADPGYQADKKQRYDITTKAKAKAAYSYLSQSGNAKAYTGPQLKRIMGRIKAALKKFGVTVAAEGWTIEPALLVTEAIAEYAGMDPSCAGSYSLSATNGPTTVTVCSYGLDPADLQVILAQACKGAGMALCALDPDMDADIDVPGADAEDIDGDAGQMDNGDGTEDMVRRIMSAVRGESDENVDDLIAEAKASAAVTETAPEENPAPEPAAADREEQEVPAVSETTTTETAATAPASFSQADLDAAVERALAAKKAAKAAKRAKAAESAPAAPVTETAAPAGDADIARLVKEGLAAALAAEGLTETVEEKVARLVREGVTAAKQELASQGLGPGRKGLVTEHTARAAGGEMPADLPVNPDGSVIPMEKWSEAQRRAAGAALQQHVMGDRAVY